MTGKKVTDREIVESLFHGSPAGFRRRVSEVAAEDREHERFFSGWSDVLRTIRNDSQTAEPHRERIVENVMRNLPPLSRTEDSGEAVKDPTGFSLFGTLRATLEGNRLAATLVAGVYLTVVVGFFVFSRYLLIGSPLSQSPAPRTHSLVASSKLTNSAQDVRYVAFDSENHGTGTESEPFSNLKEGLRKVVDGGTLKILSGSTGETGIIDKPVRLVAVGGRVRIGMKPKRKQETLPEL